MDVEETEGVSFAMDEELVNETINESSYNDDCDTDMSEEILPPSQATPRRRNLSATYTFPDPDEPSKNLVLEFPLSPPLQMNSGRAASQEERNNTSTEDNADLFASSSACPNEDENKLLSKESRENERMDTSETCLLNQQAEVPNSPWFSYMQQRVQRGGYPMQRSLLDRQKTLFKILSDDHAYAMRHSENPGIQANPSMIRSKKTLFFSNSGLETVAGGDWSADDRQDCAMVDVVAPEEESVENQIVPYNKERALQVMNEMELFMSQIRGQVELDKDGKLEEDPLVKTYARRGTWTARQRSFFDSCVKLLQAERHVRLAAVGVNDEPILRRISLDKASGRFRRLMASVEWNGRLVYWLHNVLLEGLNSHMLAIYFEILQTLKLKIPELVNSLLNYMLPPVLTTDGNIDDLVHLMDAPWDPVGKSVYRFDKALKLPKNPIFVVAPHPYSSGQENISDSRINNIIKFLTKIGTVVQVDAGSNEIYTPSDLYKNMLLTTRDTLIDLRKVHPDRPLVLIGLGIGSMVACQASLLESCAAIVCFGFPLKTPRGIHGDYGDPLLKIDAAVQFILGLDAINCPHAEFHDFWDRLNTDTEVVWAAGCDEYLRMKSSAKMSLKLTQAMVDRCFMDTVINFLQQALLKDRIRRADPIAPEVSKKRKPKLNLSPSRTPTKKAKIELSPEISDKSSKKLDLLISESTTSSQDNMSTGGSQSSSDTLASELFIKSEFPAQEQSPPLPPNNYPNLVYQQQPAMSLSDNPLPRPMNEQSTLSIHFTTQQFPVDPRRSQNVMFEPQRRMQYPDSPGRNNSSWMPNNMSGVVRSSTPRISVIAHTNSSASSSPSIADDVLAMPAFPK